MRILVTNDDGVNSPGLKVLREIAEEFSSDVWVIAPELNQSGVSHSLTLFEPLRYLKTDERTYAVRGTPTDCVIMGVRHILADEPPALVLAGVNWGANLAEDVSYSGTIAGAIEGTLLGIRSVALSLMTGFDPNNVMHWETPRAHGPRVLATLLDAGWPEHVLLNVNFPDLPPEKVSGTQMTVQGRRDAYLEVEERLDPWGKPYYWLRANYRFSTPLERTDIAAILAGKISVTPLMLDRTHQPTCSTLADAFAEGAPRRTATTG